MTTQMPNTTTNGVAPASKLQTLPETAPLVQHADLSKGKVDSSEEKDQVVSNASQLSCSFNSLASLMAGLTTSVNSLRASIHDQECRHAFSQNQQWKKLDADIEELGPACKKKFVEISQKLAALTACRAPQELSEQISEQCQACEELLALKNKLAEEIRDELKAVDEDYHEMFRKQTKDVDALVAVMGCQVINLQESYIHELSAIEDDFLAQQKDLLLRNKAEIDTLMKKVRTTESSIKENLVTRTDEYSKAIDTIRTQDAEDYNLLKVRLETDMQTLEQHLESMQAAYQLNSEKLDYNYCVLVERDHDNYITAGQQKRKLTKQRDTLSILKGRHVEYERRFLLQNGKLAVEYEKVIKLLQDLQSKQYQLHTAQQRQHREFFNMHQHSLAVLVSKVLQADKKIHEEQLGWQWHPPSDHVFSQMGSSCVLIDQEGHETVNGGRMGGAITLEHNILEMPEEHMNDAHFGEISHLNLANQEKLEIRSLQDSASTRKEEGMRLLKISNLEKHWGRYTGVIAPKVLHVWTSFEVSLLAYNQLLKNRAKLMQEVWFLMQENGMLQKAVNYCFSSKGHMHGKSNAT